MKKILFLTVFLLLTAPAFAEVNPVRITGGQFKVRKLFQGGTMEMRSNVFAANGSFLNGIGSAWEKACSVGSPCYPGKTFRVGGFYVNQSWISLYVPTFAINGKTYQGTYFGKALFMEGATFFIPRISKRKGFVYLRKPFKLSGGLSVCEVNDRERGCPEGKVLFDGDVSGHGTLIVKLKIKTDTYTYNGELHTRVYLEQESFDYVFEP